MGMALSRGESNNFDACRLFLASLVLFAHYDELSGASFRGVLFHSSGFAVDAFFIISGFLIWQSYERRREATPYAIRRIFRIYPLYASVVIAQFFCQLLLEWSSCGSVAKEGTYYLLSNLAFLNFLKPTMCHPFSVGMVDAINPSLWTLKIEVSFYVLVPFIAMLGRRKALYTLVVIFVFSTVFYHHFEAIGGARLAKQLPGQMRFFIAGIFLYYIHDFVPYYIREKMRHGWYGVVLSVALLMVCLHMADDFSSYFYPVIAAAFVYAFVFCAPLVRIPMDISYGVYVIHAPVIQMLLVLLHPKADLSMFLLVCAIAYPLSIAAALLIERPAINLGGRLARQFSTAAAARHSQAPV